MMRPHACSLCSLCSPSAPHLLPICSLFQVIPSRDVKVSGVIGSVASLERPSPVRPLPSPHPPPMLLPLRLRPPASAATASRPRFAHLLAGWRCSHEGGTGRQCSSPTRESAEAWPELGAATWQAVSDTPIGVGGTAAWRLVSLQRDTTVGCFFDVAATGKEGGGAGAAQAAAQGGGQQQQQQQQQFFLQFVTTYCTAKARWQT